MLNYKKKVKSQDNHMSIYMDYFLSFDEGGKSLAFNSFLFTFPTAFRSSRSTIFN
jgi:hypothetical protein